MRKGSNVNLIQSIEKYLLFQLVSLLVAAVIAAPTPGGYGGQ